jgi:peptidoglycan/LPS O-acetylase OafA/YrhL
MVETGDGIRPMHWHLEKPIRLLYYDFLDDFLGAQQQAHPIDFKPYATRDPILYWSTLAAMVFFGIGRWLSGSRWPAVAGLFVFLVLAGNAIVCGAFSNPNHRYQGRLAWLPLMMVLLVSGDLLARSRREARLSATDPAGETVAR